MISLAAAGCSSSGTKSSGAGSQPLSVSDTTLGQAFLAGPLAGATVKLVRPGGSVVNAAGAYDGKTDEGGLFQLHPKRLPKDFTVVVSGGSQGGALFDGDVKTAVANYNGNDDVGVNPVTSVIAAYRDDHGDQSIGQVTARVKQFFAIGPQQDVGLSLQQRDEIFSGKAFVDAANGAGGFNAFVTALAKDVAAGRPARPFPGPPKNAVPYGAILTVTLLIAKYGYCALGNTGTTNPGQPASAGSVAMGCVAKTVSGGGSTDPAVLASLADIHKKLDLISQQISDVGAQLSKFGNDNAQGQWNLVVDGLKKDPYALIDSAFQKLEFATDTSSAYTANDRKMWADRAVEILKKLDVQGADSTMKKLLIGGEANESGVIRQFASLARVQSGRFFRNPSAVTAGGFNPANIQNVWNYLDAYQAKLEFLMVERANVEGFSQDAIQNTVVYPYLGKPAFLDTNPPQPIPASTRLADCPKDKAVGPQDNNCRGWREQELRLVPMPLPDGVAIDTETGLMWYEPLLRQEIYDTPGVTDCRIYPGEATGCRPFDQVKRLDSEPSCLRSTGIPAVCLEIGRNKGFTNWERPSFSSGTKGLERLLKGAPPGQNIGEWLSAAGGFFAVLNGATVAIPKLPDKRVWTSQLPSGVCPRDECGANPYLVVDLGNGNQTTADGANPATKLWSIAVRSLGPCERYYDDVTKPAPTC